MAEGVGIGRRESILTKMGTEGLQGMLKDSPATTAKRFSSTFELTCGDSAEDGAGTSELHRRQVQRVGASWVTPCSWPTNTAKVARLSERDYPLSKETGDPSRTQVTVPFAMEILWPLNTGRSATIS
jgi:hypothetical protein